MYIKELNKFLEWRNLNLVRYSKNQMSSSFQMSVIIYIQNKIRRYDIIANVTN